MNKSMLPTKVCMFYEVSETILLFGLRYLHLGLSSRSGGGGGGGQVYLGKLLNKIEHEGIGTCARTEIKLKNL